MEDDEGAQLTQATRLLDEAFRKNTEVQALLDDTANRFMQLLELVQWVDVQRKLLGDLLTEAVDYLERGNGAPAEFIERARNVMSVMRP
jgi:hypothetical protein